MAGKKPGKFKKILSIAVTVLLILAAVLCFIAVSGSLFRNDPSVFGFRCFFVMTGSMEPTIHQNALVMTRRADVYEKGDVITFLSEDPAIAGKPNTHRILEVIETADGIQYVTKGDANPAADSLPVPADHVYGKEVFHTGKAEWVGKVLDFVLDPKGFLLLIIVPVVLVVGSLLRDYVKTWKKALEEMKNEARAEVLARTQPADASAHEQKSGLSPETGSAQTEAALTPEKSTEKEEKQ